MTLFYSEELRLLLEICILLLKANRKIIPVKELDDISKTHFGVTLVSNLLVKEKLAIINKSIVELIYPQWYYEEMMAEIKHNKLALSMRTEDGSIWIPFYCQKEIEKEIKENKFHYLGTDTQDDKIVSGIGEKSICIEDKNENKTYHWFNMPKHVLFNYDNAFGDGYEKAEEILKLHCDYENNHLKYILFNKECPELFICTENIKIIKNE